MNNLTKKYSYHFLFFIFLFAVFLTPTYAEQSTQPSASQPVKKMDVQFTDQQDQTSQTSSQDDWNMASGPANPADDFRLMQERLLRLFDPFYGQARMRQGGMAPMGFGSAMRADMEETADQYILTMDLPGYSKDDIELKLVNNALLVQAAMKNEKSQEQNQEEGRRFVSQERFYGTVSRVFPFQQPVKEKGISAKFENGILTVHVPKAAPEKSVQIPIQ